MTTVITYGTYDLLHYGHIKLLERAKALGDYLIVGVTADDFDKKRGKINVQQSLMERVENVRNTGLADKIIVEEYEGQKIDDILRYDVDIFTVGSDWKGKFDYLNEYCKVVYLERTAGISSTDIRTKSRNVKMGLVGEISFIEKYYQESLFVNGLDVTAVCTNNDKLLCEYKDTLFFTNEYSELLKCVDVVYIASSPEKHYLQIKEALKNGKHVLCEAPITLNADQCSELFDLSNHCNCILMDSIKTAYSTAYDRLLLLIKGGAIGKVISVDSTCTSLTDVKNMSGWSSLEAWGPTALLPIFQVLGVNWVGTEISSIVDNQNENYDLFTKISFRYENAVASLKVGNGVKSEGELIISGTEGYVYVPAPWWKTDYFEIRYEDPSKNKRHFYELDGEGIRYELVAFLKSVENAKNSTYIDKIVSEKICSIMDLHKKSKFILKI